MYLGKCIRIKDIIKPKFKELILKEPRVFYYCNNNHSLNRSPTTDHWLNRPIKKQYFSKDKTKKNKKTTITVPHIFLTEKGLILISMSKQEKLNIDDDLRKKIITSYFKTQPPVCRNLKFIVRNYDYLNTEIIETFHEKQNKNNIFLARKPILRTEKWVLIPKNQTKYLCEIKINDKSSGYTYQHQIFPCIEFLDDNEIIVHDNLKQVINDMIFSILDNIENGNLKLPENIIKTLKLTMFLDGDP